MNTSKVKDPRFWTLWKKSGAVQQVTAQPIVAAAPIFVKESFNEFLYPKSRQFPFDEVCEKIVRELEKRSWQVPGISVEFHEYGSGAQKVCCVSRISGEDFKLWFCRVQGLLSGGKYNDTAAVTEIIIPKKELHVYEDESGPRFYIYAGKNWKRDKQKFMDGSKVNSKLNGEPKTYLEYEGACDCRATAGAAFGAATFLTAVINDDRETLRGMKHTHQGRRPPLLAHTNDLGREYDPEESEPKLFKTAAIMEEFRGYLEENVLKRIMSYPVAKGATKALSAPPETSFPWLTIQGSIFTFCNWKDAERIKTGKLNPLELVASERYGMYGSGYRFLSLDIKNDGTVPKIAYEGFLWCGIAPALIKVSAKNLEIPGYFHSSGFDNEKFVVKITPKGSNNIYIADHAPYEKRRKELADALEEGRTRFTDAEVADFMCARGRTIIPISEYRGGFTEPVILINRELGFDEVEIASGPIKIH